MPRKAIIIGAGPAGLTAAYELLKRTDIIPIVLEKSSDIGGISKTVNYKGNRIDIGGHRFFSKSDRVMNWWLNILPIEPLCAKEISISYQRKNKTIKSEVVFPRQSDAMPDDKVMLVRERLSRIYFLRKFFTYPITLSIDTLCKLGLTRTVSIMLSYIRARLFPRKPEKNLEDFLINRFGNTLYRLFFKDYTEKVWGVPCSRISAEWGAQRVKGISITKAIEHALKSLRTEKKQHDIGQKGTETSLIERFLYPKFGPGQLWEEVAREIEARGGTILMQKEVRKISMQDGRLTSIEAIDNQTGEKAVFEGDYFFSTMPVQELVAGMGDIVPINAKEVAQGLQYRDFITVGVLLKRMVLKETKGETVLPDTWIYIQDRDVKVGRLQIFNNWSPFMVKDPGTVWIGMEYFCNKTDDFWLHSDEDISSLAIAELHRIGLAQVEDVLDSTVLRMEKTYPAYFGSYERFDEIREFVDRFGNLFLIGRNGMHKYNNSDHSMLTAMVAVDNILAASTEKANIWSINTEQEYHEEKETCKEPVVPKAKVGGSNGRGFREFLLHNKRNKAFLWIAGIAILLQFVVFKYFYPQAGFINYDSYEYIYAASLNFSIDPFRPVGYANFLRLFSVFTYSDTALVAFQYLLLELSSLLFVFTLFYFYPPARWTKVMAFSFAVFNPVWLYLANYVSSDALFVGLSVLWFTTLLWLLERPATRLLVVQVILLFYLFTVRYNALYYPIITTLALFLTRKKRLWKLGGIAASVAVVAAFIFHTANLFQEQTGVRIFSPFSGWQLANNAVFAYHYVDSAQRKPVPSRFRSLDKMVRQFFDTTKEIKRYPAQNLLVSTFYMWIPRSPLQMYMALKFKNDSTADLYKRWTALAPMYGDYGSWLIRTYPREYFSYYILPNAWQYYAPPVEFLNTYNMGIDTIAKPGRTWFHYKNKQVRVRTRDLKVTILDFYPIFIGALNVIFLLSFLSHSLLKGFATSRQLTKATLLVGGFWLVNFGFSVFASPVALRFQLFPVLVSFSFALLLLDFIIQRAFAAQPISVSGKSPNPSLSKPANLA